MLFFCVPYSPRHIVAFKKMSPNASIPRPTNQDCNAFYLASPCSKQLGAWSRNLISTDLQFGCPPQTSLDISSVSSLAINHGIISSTGVINIMNSGILWILVINHSPHPFELVKGDFFCKIQLKSSLSFKPLETPASSITQMYIPAQQTLPTPPRPRYTWPPITKEFEIKAPTPLPPYEALPSAEEIANFMMENEPKVD